MSHPFACPSVRKSVSDEEWQARVELAALYRTIARMELTDLTANHITLKVPGTEDQFLLNPLGLYYEEVTASSLMKIDASGNILVQPEHGLGINYTGFVIHGAIHEARPEIQCAIHVHSRAGVAVSAMQCGLLKLNQTSLLVHDLVGYHDYEGPALNLDERKRLTANIGTDKYCLIMRNHGLLACGRTIAEAFFYLHSLESACRIQVDVLASGAQITQIAESALETSEEAMVKFRKMEVFGKLDWAAEIRKLDRMDSSFRE
jgi:ribulose-5-phosphate 4-epimerase/fuculose-1-phosphate aldolase